MAREIPYFKEDQKFYTKIRHDKIKQVAFNLLFAFSFFTTTIILARTLSIGGSWQMAVLPIILFNIPVILAPLFQHWDYKPWQVKTQKYEQHYID